MPRRFILCFLFAPLFIFNIAQAQNTSALINEQLDKLAIIKLERRFAAGRAVDSA